MKEQRLSDKSVCLLSAVIGAVAFIVIYGVNVLNPVYDAWLFGRGDLTQHYLGWCFYRRADWTFPFGLTNNLAYPSYTSVIFTDSIPVLAVFFKVLSPVLPDKFQYFGWWGIVSFALQGFFSAKILQEFSVDKMQTLIGSIFFVVSPIAIERMFHHTALGGHWLILVAIYLYIRHKESYQNVRTALYWGIVGALVAAIHMYYLPMCGAFLCGYTLCSFLRDKSVKVKYLFPGIFFSVGLLGSTYLMGGFSTRMGSGMEGLGEYSFNLNGFFNAKGYSRFFEALPMYHECQYEGFAYLGLGIFVLMVISIVSLVMNLVKRNGERVKGDVIQFTVGIFMVVGLLLFAASPLVTWNDKLLFVLTDSSTLTHYWNFFRSTGRIIWPVCYLIYIVVIVSNSRFWVKYVKNKMAAAGIGSAILVSCCFLQLFDISGKLSEQREYFGSKKTYVSPFQEDIWQELAGKDEIEHLVWVSNSYENHKILEVAKWAYDNGLTMNLFYFARGINVIEDTQESLQNPDDTYLFVFKPEELEDYVTERLNLYYAGEYIVGTTLKLKQKPAGIGDY